MTYNEALNYIHSTLKLGSKLGLDNIRYLLNLMGNPQHKVKFIHVAGTNGKGSVCAYITNILKYAGYNVGMYISPYVEEFCERIQINRQNISENDLAEYTERVKFYIDKMVSLGQPHPTEFEIITAIAILYFFEKKCDFVLLEVGLGGRLDATNVIESPLVSVITNISFDHMEYLGNTLAAITAEKCGIIKENGNVVSYPVQDDSSMEVILEKCGEAEASLVKADLQQINIRKMDINGSVFDYKNYKNLEISLLGEHQVYNAVTALETIGVMKVVHSIPIATESIYNGLKDTKFGGRFEVISNDPLIIIDGAHNYSGVLAFKNAVQEYLGNKKKIIIMGMLKDKEHKKCIEIIAPLSDILITVTPDNPRSLSAQELAHEANGYAKEIHVIADKYDALDFARSLADENSAICVCGSLYLIGNIK